MSEIPEEIRAMAWMVGQSKEFDNLMTEQPKDLITNGDTIKRQIAEYQNMSRQQPQQPQQQAPTPAVEAATFPQIGIPYNPTEHVLDIPQVQSILPQYQEPSTQMEFNLDPNSLEILVNHLKEISIHLKKQTNLLQSIHDATSKEKGIPELSTVAGKDK